MRILIAAKQNQKFPFHFLSAPPTPPAEEKKKGKEIFWFLHTRVRERVRGAIGSYHHAIRAYEAVSSHHALRACFIRGSAGNESELFGIMTTILNLKKD